MVVIAGTHRYHLLSLMASRSVMKPHPRETRTAATPLREMSDPISPSFILYILEKNCGKKVTIPKLTNAVSPPAKLKKRNVFLLARYFHLSIKEMFWIVSGF